MSARERREASIWFFAATVLAGLLAGAMVGGVLTGLVAVRGWDWAIGTDTAYCGVYLPHLDAYCQHGR